MNMTLNKVIYLVYILYLFKSNELLKEQEKLSFLISNMP